MKARIALAAFLAVLATAGLPAQSNRPAATSPSVAPGEPEILMPQVILQIEDLSVEKVQAQLPPEEDLLPPERKIPVLREGDLAIGEPTISAAGVPVEPVAGQTRDRLLSAEIVLGAGSQNRIEGSLSLKTIGQDPRFSLLFNHETLDGFSGNPPGAGFSLRNDILDGSLKFRLGSVDTALGGSFQENETGMQNQPFPYVARLGRTLSGTAAFSLTPLDWLTLNAGVEGGTDSLTLKGALPLQLDGARIAPSLSAQARVGPVKFGVETRYSFRGDPASAGGQLQRFQASASFAADLPASFILEGAVGWSGNDAGLSRFPFSITVTGTPFDFLTLTLGGGYRVTPYDMHDVLAAHPLALPTDITDDSGWFGDASFQLTLTRDLAVTLKLAWMASESLPMGAPGSVTTQDPGSGLFIVTQDVRNRLSSGVGARWAISPSFSLSAGWEQEYMERPFFMPLYSINTELVGLEPAGKFGGTVLVSIAPTVTNALQLPPVLRISGFWKVSESVKLQLAGDDLLGPILSSPRLDISPFVTPGFRITASLGMSL